MLDPNIPGEADRDQALKTAEESSQKAQDLLDKLNAVLTECNSAFPCGDFGLTAAQKTRQQMAQPAIERLTRHANKFRKLKADYEQMDLAKKEEDNRAAQVQVFEKQAMARRKERSRAIAFCLKHEQSFDKFLTVENAVDVAIGIAFQMEIDKRTLETVDGFMYFAGKNCDDPCKGWNPEHRRCECGNRRVTWIIVDEDLENFQIAAEAY